MGSRIRDKAKHLFEVFVEIAKPAGIDEAPFIIQQYPPDFDDKEALMMIPRFAYPCSTDASQVDHFTFVLTDLDSMFRFGYCRHATGHQTCLCIVSWLPWFEIFYKMLDLLAEITNRSENNHVTTFLHATYTQEVPLPKMPVTIVADQDMFSFTSPDPNSLPKIPGSRNLTEYYNAVDPNSMMLIFASMLHERRIYMTSKKLSRLTACIHAAEALLYPMHWQHLFIPILPAHLIDYISAPMPYLIGVHSNLVEKLKQNRVEVGDAVVVDLDNNTVTSEYDDLGDLPEDVSSYLKRNLKTDVIKNSVMKMGDAIPMAFLNALVRLIGGYRDALKFRAGEPITFDPESFVHSRPSQSTQAFLEGMLTLQIFQQFIYGRLEMLNAGDGFRDIFEQQASQFTDKLNSQSRYKEWLKSVKKSGKKSWTGLKVKVKAQGKKAMADFKTKLSGLTDNEEKKGSVTNISGGVIHTKSPKPRPHTAHAGSLPRTQRLPSHSNSAVSSYERRTKAPTHSRSIEDTQDDSQIRLSYHTIDMSLMTDIDIQASMMRSASAEILSNDIEDSSDASESDTNSENDVTNSTITFDTLQNSDEDLNFLSQNENRSVERKDEAKPSLSRDKLILTRPRPETFAQPVAKPRRKKLGLTTESTKQDQKQSNVNDDMSEMQFKTIQDAPLIKFDSSESEPTDSDNFDPLSPLSPYRAQAGFESMRFGNEANLSPRVSPTNLISSTPDEKVSENYSAEDIFDPLSGLSLANNVQTSKAQMSTVTGHRSDPLSSHSPRRDSADLLMHEWSLASLSRSHNTSLPRAPQPLRMRYPNNPFVLGSSPQSLANPSAFSSAPVSGGGVLQGHHPIGQNQNQYRGLYLGQKVTDFHRGNQLGPRQPLRAPNSSLPTPRQLSTASYAPYSHPNLSMIARPQGMMGATASPVSSHPSPSTNSQSPSKSTGLSSASSQLGPSSEKRSDLFSDLLDIDFGGQITSQEPQQQQPSTVSTAHPAQSAWETFE